MNLFFRNIVKALKEACRPTLKTTSWLLKIMIPISLIVSLLQYYGVIEILAGYIDPIFSHVGLPGSAAIAFLTGAFVTTYAGMAVMLSMALTLRQATIITIMMCLCHALPMESSVVRKTGSSFMRMSIIRLAMAFVCAFYLNMVLPEDMGPFGMMIQSDTGITVWQMLQDWTVSSIRLSVMIFTIIYCLMIVQRLMEEYNLIPRLSRPLRPLMKIFGLPEDASYMWLVGNVLGISYGCAVMMDMEERGVITKEEANDVNYHLIMNHSLIEDTCVFAAIGISAFWIVSTRVLFALVVVWGRKLLRCVFAKI